METWNDRDDLEVSENSWLQKYDPPFNLMSFSENTSLCRMFNHSLCEKPIPLQLAIALEQNHHLLAQKGLRLELGPSSPYGWCNFSVLPQHDEPEELSGIYPFSLW